MAIVRVKADIVAVSVQHPEAFGAHVILKANEAYDANDPLVRAYKWAFESDIEEATAMPGERRNVRPNGGKSTRTDS